MFLARHTRIARKILTATTLRSGTRSFSQAVQNYDFTNLVDMQITSCKNNAKSNFLGTKVGDKFEYITFEEFANQVDKCRGVLAKHRVGMNDKVKINAHTYTVYNINLLNYLISFCCV
jgi:long-subunit acyl-CoA synthetase (AMP-forming)